MANKKNKKNKSSKAKVSVSAIAAPNTMAQTAAKPSPQEKTKTSSWQSYGLDQIAQKLVLNALEADRDCLNQSYKMRMATSYGLERFWGEHLRLRNNKKESDRKKSDYWKATWDELVAVMNKAGVRIPNNKVSAEDTASIRAMSEELWQLDIEVQRVALAVLTQLCDCIVWWTQRYKGVK